MTFPGSGCQTCKTRRIKCDGTQPTCQRCTKSKRICLAVKQTPFSIHVENCYASGKIKRPRGPRSSLAVLRPQFDLQTQALGYYLHYHIQALTYPPNLSQGLTECISAWQVSGGRCPMVELAISSMALAVFSRTQKHPPAAMAASSAYCHLLRLAQKRIAELEIPIVDEQNTDACLLAVFLMGRYEASTHRPRALEWKNSFTSMQVWSHHDGAIAILKAWNDKPSHKTATLIVKQTRRLLIKSFLLRNLPVPDWMADGAPFGEHELELDYDNIVVRIVNLHHASASLPQRNTLQTSKVENMDKEARDIEETLQDWATNIPSQCAYQQHIIPNPGDCPRKYFYSSTVYSYPSSGYAAAWSQYFAVKMLIFSVHLRILERKCPNSTTDFTHEHQRRECVTQLEAAAESLASSLPFCLDRFKINDTTPGTTTHQTAITLNTNDDVKPYLASLAVWPLTIASYLEGINAKHQLWFRSELARLGRITGDGILECAENDQWAII